MKNLLTLHEAVAVALLSQPNRTATFQTSGIKKFMIVKKKS